MAISETPEVLVTKGENGELSPNPALFGFTKQLFVDSLPINGEVDVLYLVKVYNGGELIGYRPYRFSKIEGYVRVFNTNTPNLKAEDGGQETPVQVVTEPQEVPEKVFNGKVVFNKKPTIEGKPLDEWVDSHGGVTEQELANAISRVEAEIPTNAEIKALAKEEVEGAESGTIVDGLGLDSDGNLVKGSAGEKLDADVTVEIENDYTNDNYAERTNYATPITLAEFIANCEAGNVYTNDGIIAKINNLLDEHAFRVILIGRNHEVLAYDDTTQAKTTWQFLDMPEHQVRLGLPFNVIDWGSNMGRAYANAYLDGTNADALTWYPSNRGGLITAQGLLNCLHTIFEGLPLSLKRAIKTVRKAFAIPRQYRSIAASGGTETDSGTTGYLAQKLFHLTATELGSTSYGTEGTAYSYLNSNARRIRYYNNSAAGYWAATPHPSNSHIWVSVNFDGDFIYATAHSNYGVAPAFCI